MADSDGTGLRMRGTRRRPPRWGGLRGVLVLLLGAAGSGPASAGSPEVTWMLNCQGCHQADGSGSPGAVPALGGSVARFLQVPGGREYLGRVPGVASAPLGDSELAGLINWMLVRYDPGHLPEDFRPYEADEVGALRRKPLSHDAATVRARLLAALTAEENR